MSTEWSRNTNDRLPRDGSASRQARQTDLSLNMLSGEVQVGETTVQHPVVVIREPGRTPLHVVLHEPLQIGRDCAGLLLNDPQISRLHLELRPDGGRVMVADLGSTNGTTIDGNPLVGPAVPLAQGSVVTAGDTTIALFSDLRATSIAGASSPAPQVDLRKTSIDLVADAVADAKPELTNVNHDQGTLTIVFSDIEGSTQLVERIGDQKWYELLSHHNRIVRDTVRQHRGAEIKAEGDGFMFTFPSARSAVLCMIEVQKGLDAHGTAHPEQRVSVRVGIHTGEVIMDDGGDLFGKHVHLAARVANAASGGEILVSSLVRELIDARGDLHFGEPRSAELKGLSGSHTMFPVVWD